MAGIPTLANGIPGAAGVAPLMVVKLAEFLVSAEWCRKRNLQWSRALRPTSRMYKRSPPGRLR